MRVLFLCVLSTAAALAQSQTGPTPSYIEGERKFYNEIYEKKPEYFTSEPNRFLVTMIKGRKPGRALDVAMGQGRNALWLASQGWQVTGFDISDTAIKQAKEQAVKLGLEIEALVTPYEQFDWGKDRWDLIVFSYFLPQSELKKAWDSLRAGGLVVVEGFHIDTARLRPVGGGYHNNELLHVFERYRILRYEDVEDRQDWGREFGETNRLVRVLAQKPQPLPPGCSWQAKSYTVGEAMCWGIARWTCGAEGWEWSGKCPDGDADMIRKIDKEHLSFAAAQSRAVYSFNAADFHEIHADWMATGRARGGIIPAQQKRYSLGEQIRRPREDATHRRLECVESRRDCGSAVGSTPAASVLRGRPLLRPAANGPQWCSR